MIQERERDREKKTKKNLYWSDSGAASIAEKKGACVTHKRCFDLEFWSAILRCCTPDTSPPPPPRYIINFMASGCVGTWNTPHTHEICVRHDSGICTLSLALSLAYAYWKEMPLYQHKPVALFFLFLTFFLSLSFIHMRFAVFAVVGLMSLPALLYASYNSKRYVSEDVVLCSYLSCCCCCCRTRQSSANQHSKSACRKYDENVKSVCRMYTNTTHIHGNKTGKVCFDERNSNQTGGSILDHVTKWASEFRHRGGVFCAVYFVSHRSIDVYKRVSLCI